MDPTKAGRAGEPQEQTAWQDIKGGFAGVGKGIARGANSAKAGLDAKCDGLGKAVSRQLSAFLAKPSVIKLGMHISSLGGKAKETAGDAGQYCLSKLGFKNKSEEKLGECNSRFEKLDKGLAKMEHKALKEEKESRKTYLEGIHKEVIGAKKFADDAHTTWKAASSELAQAQAKFKEARHETGLAQMDVRSASDNCEKAKAELKQHDQLPGDDRASIGERAVLCAKMEKAEEALEKARDTLKACLEKEDGCFNPIEDLQAKEKETKTALDQATSTYDKKLADAAKKTGIDTRSTSEKVKAGAGEAREIVGGAAVHAIFAADRGYEGAKKLGREALGAAGDLAVAGFKGAVGRAGSAVTAADDLLELHKEKESLEVYSKKCDQKIVKFKEIESKSDETIQQMQHGVQLLFEAIENPSIELKTSYERFQASPTDLNLGAFKMALNRNLNNPEGFAVLAGNPIFIVPKEADFLRALGDKFSANEVRKSVEKDKEDANRLFGELQSARQALRQLEATSRANPPPAAGDYDRDLRHAEERFEDAKNQFHAKTSSPIH